MSPAARVRLLALARMAGFVLGVHLRSGGFGSQEAVMRALKESPFAHHGEGQSRRVLTMDIL